MRQVTGVVIRDAQVHALSCRSRRAELHEQLVDVADTGRERPGAFRPLRIVCEETVVLLHRGAASRRIDDDTLDAGGFEGRNGTPRECPRLLGASRVHGERAATALPSRRQHLAALRRKHPHGGLVDVGEDQPLDATGQQTDRQAAFADGRRPPGSSRQQRPDRHRRGQLRQRAQPGRQPIEQAAAGEQRLDSLVENRGNEREPHPPRIRHQHEEGLAKQPLARAAWKPPLDLRPRVLDQRPVLHA